MNSAYAIFGVVRGCVCIDHRITYAVALLSLWAFVGRDVQAEDLIKANIGESAQDARTHFKNEVLTRAMAATHEEFGDYRIDVRRYYMNRDRSFVALEQGNNLNVYFALTHKDLEAVAIPIRIPVRRGIGSYRLLLIHPDSQPKFDSINSVDDLKTLRVGLDSAWATYKTLNYLKFVIVTVADYESMFNMLGRKRFDYLPRAVNEIYDELALHASERLPLIVEPRLALHIPSATYVFVSKKSPRIAERLQLGIERMVDNGDLEQVFKKYYADDLLRANLHQRKILYIENPLLPAGVPLAEKKYWFDASDSLVQRK